MSIKRYQQTGRFQTYKQPELKKSEILKEHKRGKWCYYSEHKKIVDDLKSRSAELEAALLAIKNHQQALTPSGFEFSGVWQIADKALSE